MSFNTLWLDSANHRASVQESLSWRYLYESHYKEVWDQCAQKLEGWRNSQLQDPLQPCRSWDVAPLQYLDISGHWHTEEPGEWELDLQEKVGRALIRCTSPEEEIYALDWQHTCYFVKPHQAMTPNHTNWPVPAYPAGDHYFFIAQDFRFAIFSSCVARTITVYGAELLDALNESMPKLFQYEVDPPAKYQQVKDAWSERGWEQLDSDDRDEWTPELETRFQLFESSDDPCAFTEPAFSVTWDVSEILADRDACFVAELALRRLLVRVCQRSRDEEERLFSWDLLRWFEQHQIPARSLNGTTVFWWPLELMPRWNYSFYFSSTLEWGLYGSAKDRTLCLFGKRVLSQLSDFPRDALGPVIRRNHNGQPHVNG